jgi:23S rRNA (uracil1939-C5)-methyltransferase
LQPIVAAPQEWNYRSRVQIKCHLATEGFSCGFYQPKSHVVVAMDRCPVIAEPLNELLGVLRTLLNGTVFAGQITQLDLALGDCQRRRAVIHYHGADTAGLIKFLRRQAWDNQADLLLQSGKKSSLHSVFGNGELTIAVDEPALLLNYAAGGFAQINLAQNRQLLAAVIAAAQLTGNERVIDLYCGMGNFSLPLARRSKQVYAIEDHSPSIKMARTNAAKNGFDNIAFYAHPAEGALTFHSRESTFDLLLLDPPRSGALAVMKELLEISVPRVIYVSCDAQTMSRDLNLLLNGGYRLVSSQPFDMFPQTHHVESLNILEHC